MYKLIDRWGLLLIAVISLTLMIACEVLNVPFLSKPTPTPTSTHTPTPTMTPTITPTPTPVIIRELRLRPKQKNVFNVRMISDQEIIQTIEGDEQVTLQKIGFDIKYEVTGVDQAGNTWFDVVYVWILYEQDGPAGKISYDSSNPPQVIPPAALGYSALLGKGFSMKISSEGKVLEIEGLEEMYAAMLDALDIEDDETRTMMEEMLQQNFGEEALQNQANNCVIDFPEGTIQIGDSWTATAEISVMVSMLVESTYTLRALDGNMATIDVQSTIKPDPEAEMMEIGPIKIGYNLSGEQQGTVELDIETGWSMNTRMTQDLSGEMVIIMEEEELVIPVVMKSTTTVETVKE